MIGEGLGHHRNEIIDEVAGAFSRMEKKIDDAIKSRSDADEKLVLPHPSMRVN